MSRTAVIVMVKAPRAGEAKTRLVPPLAADEAAALAARFARDTVAWARRAARRLFVAYAPADGRAALETLLPRGLSWVEQRGEGLGARLEAVVAHVARLGFGPLIILGADSPTLPASFVREARDALTGAAADLALGPADDGGYYLIGLRRPAPGLFQNVAWSTPAAYRQTADNAARLGLRLRRLPPWYDVDTPEDLARLRDELLRDEAARRRAPNTYEWLRART